MRAPSFEAFCAFVFASRRAFDARLWPGLRFACRRGGDWHRPKPGEFGELSFNSWSDLAKLALMYEGMDLECGCVPDPTP